ncbi:DUF58 domain-containing protein [Bacillus salitolerans]|uniref:DUF58 domain-containing protein n=1 Tax=Bacillus salitolerans TaxID=1437434 RepID=A0ABW4LS23_9BACI
MRDWTKQTFKPESATVLLVIVVFLSILNYFMLSLTLSIMLVSVIVVFTIAHLYHKYVTLDLVNKRKIIRVFPDESVTVPFNISGKSIVALFYGKLSFRLSNTVRLTNAQFEIERNEDTEYYLDVSSGRKDHHLHIQAKKRGRAVMRQIEIQVFDPLFIGNSSFLFKPFYGTEILILPKMTPVKGIEKLVTYQVGNQPNSHSYFQDPLLISGIRGYQHTDSFQQIHWKASARTGELQTKILEKTTHLKWTILLNVLEDQEYHSYSLSFSRNLENHISHIAYLLQIAEKQGISVELFVNILAKNHFQLLHLEEGAGKEHVIRGLELLARIDYSSATLKPERFLKRVESKLAGSFCVILCGITKQEVLKTTSDKRIHTLPYYELQASDEGGALLRC